MDEAAVPAGGAASALDMSDHKHRAALRTAMADWPKRFRAITPERRDSWVNDLEDARATAMHVAASMAPLVARLKAVEVVRSCVQTSAMLDAAQQRDELAFAAGKLRDLHHMETLAQADRHHAESIVAGAKRPPSAEVRILMVDARGNEQHVTGLRQFYSQTSNPPSLPSGGPAGPEQAEGDRGGPPLGQER